MSELRINNAGMCQLPFISLAIDQNLPKLPSNYWNFNLHTQMRQTFLFVDGVHPGPKEKRQMRRHVMKGKNAGRSLQRVSRFKGQTARDASKHFSKDDISSKQSILTIPIFALPRTPGVGFSACWLPVHISPESYGIIHECRCTRRLHTVFLIAHIT